MAEAFGIVSGAVGIATAFTACIDLFEYVHIGRRFGKDYQTNQLRLTLLQLRLSRWGEAVHVYDNPQLGRPSATETELEIAKNTIFQILVLFEDSQKTCMLYDAKHRAKEGDGSDSLRVTEGGNVFAINNKMKHLAIQRRKKASMLNLIRWAIHDSATLQRLIDGISALLEQLESLFPGRSGESVQRLAEGEVAGMEREQAKFLAATSKGVDPALHGAAAKAAGHAYKDIEILGGEDAGVLNGNTIAPDFVGSGSQGATHSYQGIKITGTKGLLVQNGDRSGGLDFFSRK